MKDLNEERIERRAKAIAAMGLVNRQADRFVVSAPGLRGDHESFSVSRNSAGAVECTCKAYSDSARSGFPVRCEHIHAVKFALDWKDREESAEYDRTPSKQPSALIAGGENTNTESCGSARGEQRGGSVEVSGPAIRPVGSNDTQRFSPGSKQGDIEMKRTVMKESDGNLVDNAGDRVEERSNVLEFSATLRELKKHVDPNLVKQREGWRDRNGNVQMVDYVEWHTVADILDETAPNWAHTVKDIRQIGDLMTVTVAITIDGVTREGIGTGLAQSEMGIKKAEHDALKRAAVKFGIARELYKKESEVIEREGSTSGPGDGGDDFPTNPVARSLGELVTAKQLGMIRAIARELNVDPDEECNAVMHCSTDELTKRAASSLIQHLQEMQRNSDSSAKPPLRRVS